MEMPADGRTPLAHFSLASLSRLNAWAADRMSRRWMGDVGLVVEVADMLIGVGSED